MAKIVEEKIIVKVSQIVKNDSKGFPSLLTDQAIQALEMMSEQLFGEAAIVEVTKDEAEQVA